MRNLRLIAATCFLVFGCKSAEYGGEKGTLKLRFGIGGCMSVPASESALALGGRTDLLVSDSEKREQLDAVSEAPEVVGLPLPITAVHLVCVEEDGCDVTEGSLALDALADGEARITLSEGGTLVDALTVSVMPANAVRIEDEDGRVANIRTRVGEILPLVATMRNGNTEVFARRPFTWTVEGGALGSTTSQESRVSFEAIAAGESTVGVRFGEISATLQVTVDP